MIDGVKSKLIYLHFEFFNVLQENGLDDKTDEDYDEAEYAVGGADDIRQVVEEENEEYDARSTESNYDEEEDEDEGDDDEQGADFDDDDDDEDEDGGDGISSSNFVWQATYPSKMSNTSLSMDVIEEECEDEVCLI